MCVCGNIKKEKGFSSINDRVSCHVDDERKRLMAILNTRKITG